MAHGGFKQYHFGFTGDGRTDGTEQNSSGLGDATTLCRKIICNAASCLIDAGWEATTDTFHNYLNEGDENYTPESTTTWLVKSTVSDTQNTVYLLEDSTVMEAPLTYTKDNKVTRIWLLYSSNMSTKKPIYHLDTLDTYSWCSPDDDGRRNSCGLSILYCPPDSTITTIGNTKTVNCLKLIPICGYTGSLTANNYQTLAYYNYSNIKYTYSFLCRDDYIAIIFRNKFSTTNYSSMACVGEMLDALVDPADNSNNSFINKKYAALIGNCVGSGYAEWSTHENDLPMNINVNPTLGLLCFNSSYPTYKCPYLQWYDVNGVPRTTYNKTSNPPTTFYGNGLFCFNPTLLRALNHSGNDVQYSKILIGNFPYNDPSRDSNLSKVSVNNYVKGTIHEDYMIGVGDGLFYSGVISSNLNFGQTLDNGNYMYIGAGLCIGWDKNNEIGLNDDYVHAMATPTQPGS